MLKRFCKDFLKKDFKLPNLKLLKKFLYDYIGLNNFIYEDNNYIICG